MDKQNKQIYYRHNLLTLQGTVSQAKAGATILLRIFEQGNTPKQFISQLKGIINKLETNVEMLGKIAYQELDAQTVRNIYYGGYKTLDNELETLLDIVKHIKHEANLTDFEEVEINEVTNILKRILATEVWDI